MKKIILLLTLCFPLAALAQDVLTRQQDFAQTIAFSADQIKQLAEAIPEEKYDWRPAEGVRSVGESLLHVAQGNYFMAMLMDVPPPADMNLMTMDKMDLNKEEIINLVQESVEVVQEAGSIFSDDKMMDEFSFPGSTDKMNKGKLFYIATGHLNEHLGQLIAYARMNGITPPWSIPPGGDAGSDGE